MKSIEGHESSPFFYLSFSLSFYLSLSLSFLVSLFLSLSFFLSLSLSLPLFSLSNFLPFPVSYPSPSPSLSFPFPSLFLSFPFLFLILFVTSFPWRSPGKLITYLMIVPLLTTTSMTLRPRPPIHSIDTDAESSPSFALFDDDVSISAW